MSVAGARAGGALRVHLESEPATLNPLGESDPSVLQVLMGLVYEPLVECSAPGGPEGAVRPGLAESWQLSPDGSRLSLHLRSGARWHDGRPFTVLDVQATLEPLLFSSAFANSAVRASLQDVGAIELAPDRVVRLVLKRPSLAALRALCDIPMLPDHLLRGPTADPAALNKQPVGTGPFRFATWERGKRIKLTRVSPTVDPRGAASLGVDELSFEIDPDLARALVRTRRGDLDILPRLLAVHYPDDVDPVTLHGAVTVVGLRPDRWAFVAVNHRRPQLSEAPYRRALSALWDRERFGRDLHHGLALPIAAPPFSGLEAPPGGREAAIRMFDEAGFRDSDADGVRDSGGKPFRHSLLVVAGARTAATEAQTFVLEARKAGVLIDLASVDAATLLARVRKGDFDLALMMWEGRGAEDVGALFGAGGAFNTFGYRSPDLENTLDLLRRESVDRQRAALLGTLGATLAREQPALFLYRFVVPALVANRVHGIAAAGARIDLRRAWVDP